MEDAAPAVDSDSDEDLDEVCLLKFIYSEKATKFCKIFTLLLSYAVPVKSKVKVLQNFVAFSKHMFIIGQNHNWFWQKVAHIHNSPQNQK